MGVSDRVDSGANLDFGVCDGRIFKDVESAKAIGIVNS